MNVLSLFDGMSCGQIALGIIGVEVDNYFASEIDKHAIKVTKHNYPNTKHIGDITKINGKDLPKIDLLIGGSPCQGFSFAGKQLNFEDPRSKLFFEFVRLLKEARPKYFLLENVAMKKECKQVITDHLGVKPLFINSALVSAQNRKRIYWTNIPNIAELKDRHITWDDVREYGIDGFFYTEKSMQWLDNIDQNKNRPLNTHLIDDKKCDNQRFFGILDLPENKQAVAAIRGRCSNIGKLKTKGLYERYVEFRYDRKTNALTTVPSCNVVVPFVLPNKIPADEFFFRYLTPLECERLQTVPEYYTSCVSDAQRCKMLGNGWTVEVIAHIFKGLLDSEI